ncbi:hypothetical protein X915_gp052 [Bacillus phage vB_BanS-Tsamsa]|uniref:Uncharacterized protein n=1 Tax=Bacillus phage vB_BanS-Tsamsa TaxID=1308863 RepID=U5JA04_9CAUD|nr:hypothetical protein X915_gp052 [Bacillus phage vB_BanS-Tsamsa]AGI11955.1 hypothetical protein [Bacillus phage vB_BanS-Tsamsa]
MKNLTKKQQELALEYAVAFLEQEIEVHETRRNTTHGKDKEAIQARLDEMYKELNLFTNA